MTVLPPPLPWRTFGNFWQHFWLAQLGGYYQHPGAEARNAAKRPTETEQETHNKESPDLKR